MRVEMFERRQDPDEKRQAYFAKGVSVELRKILHLESYGISYTSQRRFW
jgi:hypothetical protein